jgi:hypothetical protein
VKQWSENAEIAKEAVANYDEYVEKFSPPCLRVGKNILNKPSSIINQPIH